jgi:hypothetical protein
MNYKRFKGKGRRGKTFYDQKEANARSNSLPRSHGIPYNTKTTTTSRGGTMTCTNYKGSKP